MPGNAGCSHQRRLRRLRRHLLSVAHSQAEMVCTASAPDQRVGDSTAAVVAAFCNGVELSGAQRALRILRQFQQTQLHPPPDTYAVAAAGMADMMSDNLPKASRYIGCVVDASSRGGLDNFDGTQVDVLKSALFSRGAVIVRGVRPEMDSANARSVAAFLGQFGEPRAEYYAGGRDSVDPETSHWHPDLPLGTLQRFANDGKGVLLKSSSDEMAQAGQLAWHFDGEFNPWWTAHTALFCEATPYAGHATGYTSQRAAYLVALAHVPELIARLDGMRTLCTIEGINFGEGNPGRIALDFTREAQLRAAAQSSTGQKKQQPGSGIMSPEKYPAQYKPLLRTHYSAGYECFSAVLCYLPEFAKYWQTRHLVNVVSADGTEMGPDQSSALLTSLLQFITQDAFRYYHEWQVGDLVVWDNLACLHTVMPWDYDNESGNQRRVMWRQTMGIDDMTQSDGHVDRVGQPPFRV